MATALQCGGLRWGSLCCQEKHFIRMMAAGSMLGMCTCGVGVVGSVCLCTSGGEVMTMRSANVHMLAKATWRDYTRMCIVGDPSAKSSLMVKWNMPVKELWCLPLGSALVGYLRLQVGAARQEPWVVLGKLLRSYWSHLMARYPCPVHF